MMFLKCSGYFQKIINKIHVSAVKYRLDQPKTLVCGIIPTTVCNLCCPYCCSADFPKFGRISKTALEKFNVFFQKVVEKSKPSAISFRWYGGEPFLVPDILSEAMENIKKICKIKDIPIVSYISTNGTLLTKNNQEILWSLNPVYIQITIDGPPEIHNNRRKYRHSSRRGSFQDILENLHMLLENKEKSDSAAIVIRINVDRDNLPYLTSLAPFLKDIAHQILIDFSPTTIFDPDDKYFEKTYFEMKEFAQAMRPIYEYYKQIGFKFPKLKKAWGCYGLQPYSFIAMPNGDLIKCEVAGLDSKVGNLFDNPDVDSLPFEPLRKFNPLDIGKCTTCRALPYCYSRCPWSYVKHRRVLCTYYAFNHFYYGG